MNAYVMNGLIVNYMTALQIHLDALLIFCLVNHKVNHILGGIVHA